MPWEATPAAAQGASVPRDVLGALYQMIKSHEYGANEQEQREVDIVRSWLAQQRGQG